MAKAAYPTIGIAALVMFGIVYFIGCLHWGNKKRRSVSIVFCEKMYIIPYKSLSLKI